MPIVRKAVIPAAGFGTRFLPATKAIPKEMLPILEKPAIQRIVEEAVSAGIEEILVITSEHKPAIRQHFTQNNHLENFLEEKGKEAKTSELHGILNLAKIQFVNQPRALGLGHAILCAQPFVGNEPFAVLLGDCLVRSNTPCTKQLMDIFTDWNADVFAIRNLSYSEVHRCGVIAGNQIDQKLFKVTDLVEKPSPETAPSFMGIVGRYVLTPKIFRALEIQEPGIGGEIQLTDALKQLCTTRKELVLAHEFEGVRYDIGEKVGYIQAILDFGFGDPVVRAAIEQKYHSLSSSLNHPLA